MDSRCSSTIVINRLTTKLFPKEDTVVQRHTQVGNITTNLKVKKYFTLPRLSASKTMAYNFHVDDYDMGRYDMIY